MAAPEIDAQGVTNPSIDDLLTCEEVDPAELAAEQEAAASASVADPFAISE